MQELKSQIEILRDAEIEEILKAAKTQAEDIIKEAKNQAQRIKQQKMKQLTESLQEEEDVKLQTMRLTSKGEVLKVKSELLDEAIAYSRQILQDLNKKPRYKDALRALITEAAVKLKGNELEILVNANDAVYVKDTIKKLEKIVSEAKKAKVRLFVMEESLDCLGGTIVRTKDGAQIFSNTLDARLSKVRIEMAGRIANLLFEGAEL